MMRGARAAVLSVALVAALGLAGCATGEPATDAGEDAEAPVEQPT